MRVPLMLKTQKVIFKKQKQETVSHIMTRRKFKIPWILKKMKVKFSERF